jgi:hypothetical protein
MHSAGRPQPLMDVSEGDQILTEVRRRIAEHRNGHFHRSADGYSDPDSVVDALEDLANWITVLHSNRAKSAA